MRQPLCDKVPNSTMRLRTVEAEDLVSKPKSSKPILIAGIENQSGKKSRVKLLLGGIFQRSNSSRASDPSMSQPAEVLSVARDYYEEQYQPPLKSAEETAISQTTVLTELESLTPTVGEGFVVKVRLMEQEDIPEESEETKEEKARVGATLLQALFRGYRQRYEYRMLLLRLRLEDIKANKERQLKKIDERTKAQERHDRSAYQFQHDKIGRQLQRVSRVVPYLFREAMEKIRANAELVSSARELREVEESHRSLKKIAITYLDLLETIPGIWQALEVQWMGPKKPRIRRGFGPDGKIIKLQRDYITHDDDLPVDEQDDDDEPVPSPRVRAVALTEQSNFVNLFVQAHAHAIYSTDETVSEAVEQVKAMVGKTIWN